MSALQAHSVDVITDINNKGCGVLEEWGSEGGQQ